MSTMKSETSIINSKDMDILFPSAGMPDTETSLNLEFDPQLKINSIYLMRGSQLLFNPFVVLFKYLQGPKNTSQDASVLHKGSFHEVIDG